MKITFMSRSDEMRQSRVGFLCAVLAAVMVFSFVLPVDAKSKESSLQTYRLDKIDRVAVVQELNNLTVQLEFLHNDLTKQRREILSSRSRSQSKKSRLSLLASYLSSKVRLRLLTVATEPFYQDKSQAQAHGRHKKYPEVYRAWFKTLVASHEIEAEVFEMLAILGESASAHRSLSNILESGNAQNIVYLSKQARLHAMAGNMAAARDIVQKIQVRQQRENPVALYLPDYATFIWNAQELKAQLASAQQAYRQEQARLQKLGL